MTQHYRMTQADAIAQYKDGLISATALIYYYLKIKLAPDWKMTLHQRSVCKELGISKAAFYKGIQRLKDKGLIDWEAPNGVVVSFVQSEDTCDQSKTVERSTDACDQSETVEQNEDSLDKSETCWTNQKLVEQNERLIGQIRNLLDRSETRWTNRRLVGQIGDSVGQIGDSVGQIGDSVGQIGDPHPPQPRSEKAFPRFSIFLSDFYQLSLRLRERELF